jgi:mitochondrial fission protein ELM1
MSQAMESAEGQKQPRVWVLVSDRAGDDAQSETLAGALGWPYQAKRMHFTGGNHFHHRIFGPSLRHVDLARSDTLEPPWPDLVIASGRRQNAVSLWIREQSGGRSKLVQLGRPQADLRLFDLVVSTAQFRLPDVANVLNLELPLMRGGNPEEIAAAAARLAPSLESYARPWTALMVGGPAVPYVLDAEAARHIVAQAASVIERDGGSLFVVTSPRTPRAVADALEQGTPPGGYFYRWRPGSPDNPYKGLLGLSDRFIVTGDSVSMIVEVVRQGKPLAIARLPEQPSWRARWRRLLNDALFRPTAARPGDGGMPRALGERLHGLGFLSFSRDLGAFHGLLIGRGSAVYLGSPFVAPAEPPVDGLPLAVARTREISFLDEQG